MTLTARGPARLVVRAVPALVLAAMLAGPARGADETGAVRLEVDAREISRKLLHSREEIPVRPGKLALWYPKWIPGTHAPGGPVQNVGGLRIETAGGKAVAWRRDEAEPCRIECTVPEGTDRVVVRIDYICNQPSVNSDSADAFGDAQLGVLNWNVCLLYPEGVSIDDLKVGARLLFPAKWTVATALKTTQSAEGATDFAVVSLRDLVDSPAVFGEFMRTVELKPKDFPPTFLHLVSESPAALRVDDKFIGQIRSTAAEAGALFGGGHFDEYHFLVTLSDQFGWAGLEHASSSLDGFQERDLVDEKKRVKLWIGDLLPHEFAHSWCGKHRRPAGMVTNDFHTPERTSLLWVYEGLTQYLGDVLMVRSGVVTPDKYRSWLASYVGGLMRNDGRRWRSLEDTAIANHVLRDWSRSWGTLRRSQDYYEEGLLLWLEADAIIRRETDGKKSLDDFCRAFMGRERTGKIVPYERDEVIRTLDGVLHHDWAGFIHERVDVTQEALPLTVVARCGLRLQYAAKPSETDEENETERKYVSAYDSLGLAFMEDGTVRGVVPGTPGDKAGIAPGMSVQGVNGRKFSRERLRDAVADSVAKRQVEFLVLDGDTFRTVTVPYDGGARYLELVRNPDEPDVLGAILKPLVQGQ